MKYRVSGLVKGFKMKSPARTDHTDLVLAGRIRSLVLIRGLRRHMCAKNNINQCGKRSTYRNG